MRLDRLAKNVPHETTYVATVYLRDAVVPVEPSLTRHISCGVRTDGTMARESELTCPSGLRIRMRGIKGKDLDGLRDKRKVANGEAIGELLNNCTIEVLERAIYGKLPNFNWADVLIGDRMKAVIALREVSAGDVFDFRTRCRDTDCKEMIDWTLNLSELPVKELTPEAAEKFLNGNSFETAIEEKVVRFKLNTGRDQARLIKMASQMDAQAESRRRDGAAPAPEGRAVLGVYSRLISVDGVDNVMKWLLSLDLADITMLVKAMDAVDCGIDTTIEVICSGDNGCGLKQAVELPLDSTFFSPRT